MKSNKIIQKVLSLAFVGVLLGALLVTLALPDKTFSPEENRMLQTLPKLTWKSLASAEWMGDIELWLADQFPARSFFVRSKASMDHFLGKRVIGGAYLGKDGQYFEATAEVSDELLQKNAQLLKEFYAEHPFTFLPVYSAYTLYPERLPAFAEVADEHSILEAFGGIPAVETWADFEAKKEDNLYFLTDHHWTQDGAYLAYLAYCEAKGLEPAEMERVVNDVPFYGSLYSKAPLFTAKPDEVAYYKVDKEVSVVYDMDESTRTDSLYTTEAFNEKDQYVAFLDGNHARVDITTNANTGKQLIVLKDSFGHALIPLLANHYDTIIVLDLRYYNFPLSSVLAELPEAEVLITYNLSWLAQDENLSKLKR